MYSINPSIVTEWFISKLCITPFPYCETLVKQICESEIIFRESDNYCCISFSVPYNFQQLPIWLDTVPLSWQINIDGIPTLCQIFVNNGCVEKIEVIDMGFEKIKWDKVFNGTVSMNQEFNDQNIRSLLANGATSIEKMYNRKHSIDWMLKTDNKSALACFRDCSIRRLELCDFPAARTVSIKPAERKTYKYTVYADDESVDFDCSFLFIHWNATIG